MVACPGEIVWPEVSDPELVVYLKPAPEHAQFRRSLDEALALGGFVH